MARTFYSLVFCSALGLLATMWLRPGVAQDLLDMARGVRMQSPDPTAGAPQYATPGNVPYSTLPASPVQPMPVTRPASWPGAPAQAYNAPAVNQTLPNNSAQQSGVTVWDPATNRPLSALPSAPPNMSSLPASQNPLRSMAAAADTTSPTMAQTSAPFAPPAAGYAALGAPPAAVSPYTAPTYSAPSPTPPISVPLPTMLPGSAYPSSMPLAPASQTNSPQASALLPPATAQNSPGVPQFAEPNGAEVAVANPNMQNLQVLPSPPQELAGTKVVAKCGNEVILISDCDVLINENLAKQKIEVPPEQKEEVYNTLRRQVLKQLIEQKLVYNDIVHSIPAEGLTKIQGNINEQFDKQQLSELMKDNKVSTRQALDDVLTKQGSSIDRERRNFFEKAIVIGWMQEKIKKDVVISLAEIIGYYQQHLDDYKFPAQARWEELMVSFDQFPDKQAAWAAIAAMGNQVMQGTPLAEVAKAHSQGPTADQGGVYDWTSQGSVSSKEIDQSIFNLPVGSLSQIIESNRGFHVVRVLERKPAGKKSFEETQVAIKDQLKKENLKNQIQKYLDEVKKKTPVWTIYDDQPGGLDGPKQPERHPNFE